MKQQWILIRRLVQLTYDLGEDQGSDTFRTDGYVISEKRSEDRKKLVTSERRSG